MNMDMHTITVISVIGLIFLLITWAALIDIVLKDFSSMPVKVIWGFIVLIPFIGCLVYLLFGYRKGKRRTKTAASEK